MTPADWRVVHPNEPPPEPPPLLSEYWRFLRYGLPPLHGGMRDQPANWFEHAETLERVYRAWLAWMESDKGPAWRKAHPEEMRIVTAVRRHIYGE
ncbi:MAG: hypothetical protein GF364_22745 [Candidatus Lokiarchaeota archaeon]|nr:hypothetical protein [Candidatus Lokiarchaeota archaeon]